MELPDALARRFKATVPNRRRSRIIAELLAKKLKSSESALERAARKANTFTRMESVSLRNEFLLFCLRGLYQFEVIESGLDLFCSARN